MMTRTGKTLAALLMLWMCIAAEANAQTDDRSITKIAGDLYRFQNRSHYKRPSSSLRHLLQA